jgi:ABC-2 type transport system permease protein
MYLQKGLVAFWTVSKNEMHRTMRLGVQTILPPAITTLLYFLIFGHLMGSRIGPMNNLPYIEFIVPGLIMMNILTGAFSASVSVVYMQKWTRVIDEMLVSPMSSATILLSFVWVGVMRAIVIAIVVTLVATLCARVHVAHIFYSIFVGVLAASIFSLLGVINGLLAKTFDHISIMPTFVITPLSYLGGVFYSLDILPKLWQHVALFNPIVYIMSTFRYGFFSWTDTNLWVSTLIMLGFFVGLFMICMVMIRKRVGISV